MHSATGYAIGGVAPIGYSKPVKLLLTSYRPALLRCS